MDLWELVPKEWRTPLMPVRAELDAISSRLDSMTHQQILPAPQNIFRALQIGPQDVSVVIFGQDPYPNPAHACGLSFSVPAGTSPLPGSLRNILLEVQNDTGSSIAVNGDLQPWVEQGVMLLNRALTVQAGVPGSHQGLGWDQVTTQIARVIAHSSSSAIALLWGKQAQQLAPVFASENVITGVHPSPLSAHRGFLGSKPFSRINELRASRQQQPIRW